MILGIAVQSAKIFNTDDTFIEVLIIRHQRTPLSVVIILGVLNEKLPISPNVPKYLFFQVEPNACASSKR